MLHAINANRRWGFIDRRGNVVVEPIYKEVRIGQLEGPYFVYDGKKAGFIGEDGAVVIPLAYRWAYPFSEGLAAAQKGSTFGFIDTSGDWAIEPQFVGAGGVFSSGVAVVTDTSGAQWMIDREGKRIRQVHNCSPFVDGLATASDPADPQRRGYLRVDGTWAIEPRAWMPWPFFEGLAEVRVGEQLPDGAWSPPKVGYIDTTGAWVIEPRELTDTGGNGGPFRDGLARARTSLTGPYGYIDRTGAWAIEPQLAWARDFSEGFAVAGTSSMNLGFIDRTGRYAIEPTFYTATDVHDGIAGVNPDKKRKTDVGYIDMAGRWLWQPETPLGKPAKAPKKKSPR